MVAPLFAARPAPLALLLGVAAAATVGGAWIFQAYGYAPCELCLKERLPYYAAIALALVAAGAAHWGGPRLGRAGLWLLALLFAGSALFGAYHAGVEWGVWQGPSDCTGAPEKAASMSVFMQQLQNVKVVRCDAVAIRILGLSLAGWNAVISAALAVFAAAGAWRCLARASRAAAQLAHAQRHARMRMVHQRIERVGRERRGIVAREPRQCADHRLDADAAAGEIVGLVFVAARDPMPSGATSGPMVPASSRQTKSASASSC